MGEKCRFRSDDKVPETIFTPEDISSFRFTGSKYFISKEIGGRLVFLEYLIKGKINVYYLRDDSGDHYFLEKEGEGIVAIPYEEGIRTKDDISYFYESTNHIGLLKYYMKDAPGIESRINRIKEPEHRNLIKLAEVYNNKVCPGQSCIIFEQKSQSINLAFEVFTGLVKFRGDNEFIPEAGGFIHVAAPRVNEKLYFKTGLIYQKLSGKNSNAVVYKIPMQLEYIYPTGKLKPRVSAGVNYFIIKTARENGSMNTYCLNAGIIYRILRQVNLCADFNSDYSTFVNNIELKDSGFGIISYGFSLGLNIGL
jgi:hypothetical protein